MVIRLALAVRVHHHHSSAPEAVGLVAEAAAAEAAAGTTPGGFLVKKEVIVIESWVLSLRGALLFLSATASFTGALAGAAAAVPAPVLLNDIVRDWLLMMMLPAVTSLCRSNE